MPTWFLLGSVSALSTSFSLLVGKRLATKIDPLVATCLGYSFSVLFQMAILFSLGSWPSFSSNFVILVLGSACLDAISLTATMYALRQSPLSLLSPIDAFTPLFAVIAAFILIHQTVPLGDMLGIFLIVIGAYGLNLGPNQKSFFTPLYKLLRDRGVQFMLLASVLKGISPTLQHQAILATHPITALAASIVSFSILLILLWPFAWRHLRQGVSLTPNHFGLAILFGAIASIVTYSGWTAMGMTNPSYIVAIGRLSILFGMLWGIWFLKERVTAMRLLAGLTMLVGVVLMAVQ